MTVLVKSVPAILLSLCYYIIKPLVLFLINLKEGELGVCVFTLCALTAK
ncbi:hypothetical protein HNQ00_001638 [Flavobacterium sp. 14A]|nr:hypothetical protein [Flavobacterium sp. 14A]